MQEVIAGLQQLTFAFEEDVEMQRGPGLLPFQTMDKLGSAVCNFFAKGFCEKGKLCPFRHERGEKMVVCKHWLRGLCKKGDQCKFLHQYDVTRMPECHFYSKFGDCSNKECPFLHIKPACKSQDCPWYDQGFCRDGPLCKYRHVRKVMCINYLVGFCPKGPKCQFAHPKMNLLFNPSYLKVVNWPREVEGPAPRASATEHPELSSSPGRLLLRRQRQLQENPASSSQRPRLQRITCYRCRKMGHYANKCSKTQLVGLITK